MASDSIHVRVGGQLQAHVQQQTSDNGLYENASEYIRALIRRDLQTSDESWSWLKQHLEPALAAPDNTFKESTVADVVRRNRPKPGV